MDECMSLCLENDDPVVLLLVAVISRTVVGKVTNAVFQYYALALSAKVITKRLS